MPKASKYLLFLFLYLLISTIQSTVAQAAQSKISSLSPSQIIKVEIFDKTNGVWKDQTNFFGINQSLAFKESDNNLKIELAKFDSTNSDNFQYTYRIGKSNPWIQLENNVLEIQNILPGESILEIRHRIKDGEWDDNTFEIFIYRQQPFYFRLPFLVGILTTIIALFYFLIKRKPNEKTTPNPEIGEASKTIKEAIDPLPNKSLESLTELIPIQGKLKILEDFPTDEWLEMLLKNANSLIEDRKFSIIQLAETMNLSERQFRRKLKQKTELRPVEYMREIRLLKAEYFLINNTYSTVAEVCYAVGFSTPKHFSKIFKERFGENPSFYLNNKKPS